MLCFSVYLTLCHTDEKGAKGNPVVGSLSTMKIKDLLFSKYNYASAGARDLIIVLPKYNLSVGLILAFYFSIYFNGLFIFSDMNFNSSYTKMVMLQYLLIPLHLLYACVCRCYSFLYLLHRFIVMVYYLALFTLSQDVFRENSKNI